MQLSRNIIIAGAAFPLLVVGVPYAYKLLTEQNAIVLVKAIVCFFYLFIYYDYYFVNSLPIFQSQNGSNKLLIDEDDNTYLINADIRYSIIQ